MASKTFTVPIIFVSKYSIGSSIEGTTSESAAKWKTISTPLKIFFIFLKFLISFLYKKIFSI